MWSMIIPSKDTITIGWMWPILIPAKNKIICLTQITIELTTSTDLGPDAWQTTLDSQYIVSGKHHKQKQQCPCQRYQAFSKAVVSSSSSTCTACTGLPFLGLALIGNKKQETRHCGGTPALTNGCVFLGDRPKMASVFLFGFPLTPTQKRYLRKDRPTYV